jgi:hypothetical protein
MRVGILEFRDNDFALSVAAGLSDLGPEFIRAGALRMPSPSPYRVIIDRVSFCDPFLRELMRCWSLGGAYVLNDPFYTLTSDKLSDLLACDRLSIPRPRTVLLPRHNDAEDVREMVAEPDWEAVAAEVSFPCILKPVDGYAWQDVFRIESLVELQARYLALRSRRTLIVQELVQYIEYYRAFCVGGRDVLVTAWTPRPLDAGEYAEADRASLGDAGAFIETKTAELNGVLGLDFNSVEWCVTKDGLPVVIDSCNDVPDVRKEKLPGSCYDWIVDRFCACVREKFSSGERNRGAGLLDPPGTGSSRGAPSEPGPSDR